MRDAQHFKVGATNRICTEDTEQMSKYILLLLKNLMLIWATKTFKPFTFGKN